MADIFTVNQSKYLAYQLMHETGKTLKEVRPILNMIEEFVEKEFLFDAAHNQLADKFVKYFEDKGEKFPYDLKQSDEKDV